MDIGNILSNSLSQLNVEYPPSASSGLNSTYKSSKINGYKECDLWMGETENTWRNAKASLFPDEKSVNSNVKLFLSTEKLDISYSNTYGDGGSIMPKAIDGIMNKVGDMLDTMNAMGVAEYSAVKVTEYDNPKIWEKTGPIKVDGDLVFKFWFGSAGLYDAFEEVVRPMYVLGSLFAPRKDAEGGIQTPLPSKAHWTGTFIRSTFSKLMGFSENFNKGEDIDDEISYYEDMLQAKQKALDGQKEKAGDNYISKYNRNQFDNAYKGATGAKQGEYEDRKTRSQYKTSENIDALSEEIKEIEQKLSKLRDDQKAQKAKDKKVKNLGELNSDLLNKASEAQKKYFEAVHSGASAVLNNGSYSSDGWAIAKVKIGKFILGPFTATGATLDFDTSILDDKGYPCSGELTINGIEFYKTASDNEIKNIFLGS